MFRRRRRYRLPLIVVLVALILTGMLVGSAHLVRIRIDARAAGTVPRLSAASSALEPLSRRAPAPTPAGLHAALDALVHAHALAPTVYGGVVDVASGQMRYDLRAQAAAPPASTAKLVTAAAALTWLGPDTVFRTRTTIATARGTPTVTLSGGGDPTLAGPRATLPPYPDVAHLSDLVRSTAAALTARRVSVVRLVVDDSLFSGVRTAPGWKPSYLTEGDVSPVTALSVDAGRLRPDSNPRTPDDRASDPSLTAGRAFAALLTRAHIRVVGSVRRGGAPANGGQLASVSSPPLTALVTRMLQQSDNDIAESLFRHIAIARHLPATFAGGSVAVRQWLTLLGVDVRAAQLVDGSGLSLRDRLSPGVLTSVLHKVANTVALHPIVAALPVGGFTGTLDTRYRVPPRKRVPALGSGVVRAKTGTLTGVSALAGFVVDSDGRLLAFAFLAPTVPIGGLTAAEAALDRLAAQLSVCGCR